MGNNTITNNNYIVPCTFLHEEKYVLIMNVIMKINSKWVENIQIIRDFFIFQKCDKKFQTNQKISFV